MDARPKQPNSQQRTQQAKFTAPYCVSCGMHHHLNSACRGEKKYGVYAAAAECECDCDCDVVKNDEYIIPLFLNGVEVRAL